MDITKRDSKMLKGVAILAMLMLHLFCRRDNLPYTPLLWIGDTPLIYYFGLFGDICVPIYCFVSGYAHYMQSTETELRHRWKHLLRFLIPFWVIAAVFSVIGIFTGNSVIPGSVKEFLLNCLTIKNSYNGAWWYANTYMLLVALQPLSYRFVKRCPAWLVLAAGFVFYTVGYGIRFWGWGACDGSVLVWIVSHVGLLGTSWFPYAIGMVFCKNQLIAKAKEYLKYCKYIYIYIITVIVLLLMIFAHSIVPSLFVAVATATMTVFLLCICPLPNGLRAVLEYFGVNSTNIWLTHMFFYTGLFDGLVFKAEYPVLIYLFLLLLSLATSYVVNWISKPILKFVR